MTNFFPRWGRVLLLLALPFAAQAQSVGVGTTAPDASAALDVVSSTKGALLPRVATAVAIVSPALGLIVFQTGGTPGYYYYSGSGWQQIATVAGAAVTASNGLTKTGPNVALGGPLTTPTTIAQAGNALTLTGGNVGIGTAAPQSTLDVSGDFRVSTGSVNTTLGTTGSGNANFSGGVGQSFTLPVAASITSIRLVDGATSFSTTFQIYSGGGPSGTAQLATPQPISFTANASTTVVLPTPLALAAGVYTLFLNVGSTPIRYFNSGENYTGGNVYSGTASIAPYDLDFTVAYTSGTATSAFAVSAGGNVGIGTTGAPAQKLDVTGGSIRISTSGSGLIFPDGTTQTTAATTATGANFIQNGTTQQAGSSFNISGDGTAGGTLTAANASVTTALTGSGASIGAAVGVGIRADGGLNLGQNTTGNNVSVGFHAGQANTTGTENQFVGYRAGESNTTGSQNQFEGSISGLRTTTGSSNYFSGFQSGAYNTTGSRNHFSGYLAGTSNSTGYENQFVGYDSGQGNTTGAHNLFVGYWSGLANTTGDNNQFIGFGSGAANTSGSFNQFSGLQSGASNTTGVYNQFEGYQSGFSNTTGNGNAFGGYGSGQANTTGSANVFGGMASGLANTTGSDNVFVGFQSGRFNLTGSRNVALGREAGPTTDGLTNASAIGYQAGVSQSNSLVLGGTGANAVRVGIGTPAPSSTLHVQGTLAVGVVMGLVGNGVGTLLDATPGGYVGLSPSAGNDYYQLPAAAACPGRLYYLRNNSATNAAYLATVGGLLYEGPNTADSGPTFVLQASGTSKTITAISDGTNWTILKSGN